jgi:alginate O-acetyltransferase complex protein AlgI
MSFISFEFAVFFALVLLLRWAARSRPALAWVMLGASLAFLAAGSPASVLLLVAVGGVDYVTARASAGTSDLSRRRRLLVVSIVANVGVLAFFKYTGFVVASATASLRAAGWTGELPRLELWLPLGISYFTFSGISYAVDVYYDRIEPARTLREYLAYLAYFPKLLSGPIARAGDFFRQEGEWARPSLAQIEVGIGYVLLGLVKKIVIADQVAAHVDIIFGSPGDYDGLTLLQGALGYTVQVYCDFSGYTDIAIGCASMMGVRLPANFAMPYSSVNLAEFWRRWHITLSSWFRDYVFMPLEAATMRRLGARARMSVNLIATMGLCGLWHGAAWTFVLWGAWHGIGLAIQRMWDMQRPRNRARTTIGILAARAATLAVVVVGWVIFRAASFDSLTAYLAGLVTWQSGVRLMSPFILAGIAVVVLAHLMVDKDRDIIQELQASPLPVRAGAYSALLVIASVLGVTESAPFLYVQF